MRASRPGAAGLERRLKGKHFPPVPFHIGHRPSLGAGLIEGLVETTHMRLPVIGIFALGISVVHDAGEPRAAAGSRPFQHLLVTIRIAEGKDWAPPDEAVDTDRLAGPIVDEIHFGLFNENRGAARAN